MSGSEFGSVDAVIPVITVLVYAYSLGVLVSYVWKKLRFSPALFLLLAGIALIGGITFTALWGLAAAPFALLLSIGAAMSLVDPVVALGFLLTNVLLRPWELVAIPEMAVIPKLLGGISALSWAGHGLRNRNLTVLWNRPFVFFLGFGAWVLLSALSSGEAEGGIGTFVDSFGIAAVLFFLAVNIPNRAEDIRLLRALIVAATFGVVVAAWVESGSHPSQQRLLGRGLMGNANDLAALILIALPLLVLSRKRDGARKPYSIPARIFAGGAFVVFVAGIWLSQSRGAMGGLLFGGMAFLVGRSARPKRAALFGLLALPFVLGALSWVNLARESGDVEGSTQSRMNFLGAGARMALEHPLLGVGFDQYPRAFEAYAPSLSYERGLRTAHSTWMLALAENGFPAFFFLIALVFETFRRAWRLRAKWPELLPALVAYGTAITFLSHTYLFVPYLLFALVLAAAKVETSEVHA